MANYWEYNGTTFIKESPVRGLTGMGGGAVMSSAASGGASGPPWETSAGAVGPKSFTAGERLDGGSNIGADWADQMTNLTFQWEVYINSSATNNSWHLTVTPGWTDAGGLLIGIYSTWRISIAGPQLGGYGMVADSNLPSGSWQTCRYTFGREPGNAKQKVYLNGSADSTESTNYNQAYITFNTGIWGGAGRTNANSAWSSFFNGGLRNLKLTDTYDATF